MKYSEKLYHRYLEEIRGWSWDSVLNDIEESLEEDYDGNLVGYSYLGSVLNLSPSGKYYTCWTTNQTIKDQIKDEAFYNALDTVAEEHGCFITSGEGDACDLLAAKIFDPEDIELQEENDEAQALWDNQNIFEKE